MSGLRLVADALWTLARSWSDAVLFEGRRGWRPVVSGEWFSEVKYALRSVARDPLHAMVAVLTLALAIGANGALYSVAHSVLLRSLPYDAADRTVLAKPAPVYITAAGGFAVSNVLTDLPQVEMAAAFTDGATASLAGESTAQPVRAAHVDDRFFEVLGAQFAVGRGVVDGAEPEAVLSYDLWQRAFGADESVVGRTIRLSDHVVTVTGIAAPEVDYPAGTDVWLSYPVLFDLMGSASGGAVIARVSRPDGIADLRTAFEARLRAQWKQDGVTVPDGFRAELIPLRASLVGPVRESLILLLAASALILLLGCVNLAGLSLARHAARGGEFAVRRALGAGRVRLVRMLLTESLTVAAIAGAAALAFVIAGRSLLIRLLPAELPGLASAGPGIETLGFVAILSLLTGLLLGIVPALQIRPGGSTPGAAAGRLAERRRRLHPGLVVAQIALAVVLVISAGLLGRSVMALRSVPLGFDTDRVYTFEARLPTAEGWDTAAFLRFADGIALRLEAQPGVTTVGVGSRLPLSDGLGVGFRVWPATSLESESNPSASSLEVSPSYFAALGIRVLAGSAFATDASAAGTVVVSRGLAERMFGRMNVTGEAVRVRRSSRVEPEAFTIVGVVDDVRSDGFLSASRPAIYFPFRTRPVPLMAFAIRSDREQGDVVQLIQRVTKDVDPRVAPSAIRSMRSAATGAIAARSSLAIVSGLFGASAVMLAVLGIYGLVAQSVVRRKRELGIRLAVGARPVDLLGLVLHDAIGLTIAGILIGLIAAVAVTRLLTAFLFGVGATDPATFAAVAAIAIVAATGASLGPATRAARTDPADSLRAD